MGVRTVDVLAAELLGQLGVVDALDDRGVIPLVAEDVHVGEERGQHAQDGVVGDVARGEDERRLLAVQRGQLLLQRDVALVGAGDVSCAAGAAAEAVDGVGHCAGHVRVLAHAEVVVGAPGDDLLLRPVLHVPHRVRKLAVHAVDVLEHPIPPLLLQPVCNLPVVALKAPAARGFADRSGLPLSEGSVAIRPPGRRVGVFGAVSVVHRRRVSHGHFLGRVPRLLALGLGIKRARVCGRLECAAHRAAERRGAHVRHRLRAQRAAAERRRGRCGRCGVQRRIERALGVGWRGRRRGGDVLLRRRGRGAEPEGAGGLGLRRRGRPPGARVHEGAQLRQVGHAGRCCAAHGRLHAATQPLC